MLKTDWESRLQELAKAKADMFEMASMRNADPEDTTEVHDSFIEDDDGVRTADPFVGFTDEEVIELRSNEDEVVKAEAWIKRLEGIETKVVSVASNNSSTTFADRANTLNFQSTKVDLWDFESIRALDDDELIDHATNVVGEMHRVKDEFRTHLIGTVMEDYDERAVNMHIIATSSTDFRSAFWKLVTDKTHLLTPGESQSLHWAEEQRAALALGSGYLLPINIDPTTRFTAVTIRNPIREMASVRVISTNVHNSNTMSNSTFAMAAEGIESTDGTATVGTVAITAQQAHGALIYSMQAEEDVKSLEADLQTSAMRGVNNLEAVQMLTGNGTPANIQGVLAGAVVTRVNTAVTLVVDEEDLIALLNAMPDDYAQPNAQWLSHKNTQNHLRTLESSGGTKMFHDITGSPIEKALPSGLMGYNVRIHSGMDTVVGISLFVQGEDALIFGDWEAGYRIVDRIGTTVAPFPVLGAANRLPTGQKGMYVRWRFGGGVLDANALRVLDIV